MRRAAKIDANHTDVVLALRRMGASVQSLAAIGQGCPDLLVAIGGQLFLLEVKDGAKVPSARSLTPDQQEWIKRWNSPVHVVHSPAEALAAIGACHAE